MRIPFNDGKGGKPEPVPGASANGRSNYFARFSPDGKWLTFVQSDGGSFIKSSSDIYIMPADFSAPPRPLECNVRFAADSWFSWSSSSRWLLFASKRDSGVFARIYMTHIDEAGHASPAVRLPIDGDERMCFNVPEFCREMPDMSEGEFFGAIRAENPTIEVEDRDRKDKQ
jgi:hypothetical protein